MIALCAVMVYIMACVELGGMPGMTGAYEPPCAEHGGCINLDTWDPGTITQTSEDVMSFIDGLDRGRNLWDEGYNAGIEHPEWLVLFHEGV